MWLPWLDCQQGRSIPANNQTIAYLSGGANYFRHFQLVYQGLPALIIT
jgi:hypothetical protein